MKSVAELYIGMQLITEEIHPDVQNIMNSSEIQPKDKLKHVVKKVREMISNGQDTGLESDKPKKGSSRAVFFPKEHKEITVDGAKTKTPTAVKIAFNGQLDKYHGEDTLLGEDQNRAESDYFINNQYGVFRHERGEYHTNENPVLAPVFDSHEDHHHIEMGRIEKFNTKDMANATKTKEFPKGLSLHDVTDTMEYHHRMAHGSNHYDEKLERISQHPYMENMIDMMHNSGMHPGDIAPRNMGIYVHPVTGKRHPVMCDWGFNSDIEKKYTKARRKMRGVPGY